MHKNYILFINADYAEGGECAIVGKKAITARKFLPGSHFSELLLVTIEKLCAQAGIRLNDLEGIALVMAGGSFTGIRSAVAVANAFAFSLNIPLLGLRKTQIPNNLQDLLTFSYKHTLIKSIYEKKPNITMPRTELIEKITKNSRHTKPD